MIQVIGYGNPGRGDDGLGPAFAARISGFSNVRVCSDYQLTVDHALLIASATQVVFVDAMMGSDTPFEFGPMTPSTAQDLTSHSLSPAAVLALGSTLFEATPKGFVLGISGVAFGRVHEGLSPQARANLSLAEAYFRDWLAMAHSQELAEDRANA